MHLYQYYLCIITFVLSCTYNTKKAKTRWKNAFQSSLEQSADKRSVVHHFSKIIDKMPNRRSQSAPSPESLDLSGSRRTLIDLQLPESPTVSSSRASIEGNSDSLMDEGDLQLEFIGHGRSTGPRYFFTDDSSKDLSNDDSVLTNPSDELNNHDLVVTTIFDKSHENVTDKLDSIDSVNRIENSDNFLKQETVGNVSTLNSSSNGRDNSSEGQWGPALPLNITTKLSGDAANLTEQSSDVGESLGESESGDSALSAIDENEECAEDDTSGSHEENEEKFSSGVDEINGLTKDTKISRVKKKKSKDKRKDSKKLKKKKKDTEEEFSGFTSGIDLNYLQPLFKNKDIKKFEKKQYAKSKEEYLLKREKEIAEKEKEKLKTFGNYSSVSAKKMVKKLLNEVLAESKDVRFDIEFPLFYHASGVISLPFDGLQEPFEAWYAGELNMSRIDYFYGE